MEINDFIFHPSLFLRAPYYSFKDYQLSSWTDFLSDPYFRFAVYLASPDFYQTLASKNFDPQLLNQRQRESVKKYINRMHFRPTPFGGFSTYTVAEWGNGSQQLHLAADSSLQLSLDNELKLKLWIKNAEKDLCNKKLSLNPALYPIQSGFRFIRTQFDIDKKKLSFSLEEITADGLLHQLVEWLKTPVLCNELIKCICTTADTSIQDATDYVDELLNTQFIIAENHPGITGDLARTFKSFSICDLPKAECFCHDMEQVITNEAIEPCKHPVYANASRVVTSGHLCSSYQEQLTEALSFLQKIAPQHDPANLEAFKNAFKNRYDQQEVPLLQALDPDMGIGYADLAALQHAGELLTDITFEKRQENKTAVGWSDLHSLLIKKWHEGNHEVIMLTGDEELAITSLAKAVLPPSFAVMFRPVDEKILLESAGGVTGTSLIGRFTPFSEETYAMAREIATHEQHQNPDVVFAEILQLSGMHVDNVNHRMPVYEYDIPVNTIWPLVAERQISLSDLYLSIKNDRLVLRSKRLGREVIPRLSSAFNYRHNDLGVFRFLCDMQYQGIQSAFGIDMEQLFPGLDHYPEVRFKNVIISPSIWYLREKDIQKIVTAGTEGLKEYCSRNHLPNLIALTQHDQQLVFNLENDEDLNLLISCLEGNKEAKLQEYFVPREAAVINGCGKPMVGQFIAFLKNTKKTYPLIRIPHEESPCKRSFALGSEWLYLKLYCKENVSNQLLGGSVLSYLEEENPGIAERWFFIRYNDPEPHIRLRMLVRPENLGIVVNGLNRQLADILSNNLIHEYRGDTYHREIERYHAFLIADVEEVFHQSSRLICNYIRNSGLSATPLSYHSLAFVSVRDILNCFDGFIVNKTDFTAAIAHSLYDEFAGDKQLRISLDKKYRLMRAELNELLHDQDYYIRLGLQQYQQFMMMACSKLMDNAVRLDTQKRMQLVADLIHMHLNRLFISEQRKQELVVYYMLNKYFVSQQAVSLANPKRIS